MPKKLLTLSLFLTFLFFSFPVLAQQPSDPNALIHEGVVLRRKKQYEVALELFRQAWQLSHTPRARAQMGLTEQALGRWVEAEEHLKEALAVEKDAWIIKNRQPLEGALTVIGQHLGSLDVRGGVPGAEVRINGLLVGTLPLKQPIRAVIGTVTLEVKAPNYV